MDQLSNLADTRLINGCIYCGGSTETRDHVPSKIFLDKPYPENLPVLPCCSECNVGFSKDEEYVVCLIESAIAASTEPNDIQRPYIADILRRKPAIRARVETSKKIAGDRISFDVEMERFKNVVLKLAKGHAAYELSLTLRDNPVSIGWTPLEMMKEEERSEFESDYEIKMLGEIGSRGSQRLMVMQLSQVQPDGSTADYGFLINKWIEVQENHYKYLAVHDGNFIIIRIIIANYLACEVRWEY